MTAVPSSTLSFWQGNFSDLCAISGKIESIFPFRLLGGTKSAGGASFPDTNFSGQSLGPTGEFSQILLFHSASNSNKMEDGKFFTNILI